VSRAKRQRPRGGPPRRFSTAHQPSAADAIFTAALRHSRAGRHDEAIVGYRRALEIDPLHFNAWANLGYSLRAGKRAEAAVVAGKRALEIEPGNANVLGNVGNALKDLDRLDESLAAHRAAVEREPGSERTHRNYAVALKAAGFLEEALAEFTKADEIRPGIAPVLFDKALLLLHLARFREGWEAFEIRWKLGELPVRPYRTPRWQGENFAGKRLLIYPEQGFGDAILSSRFVPLAKERGGEVIFECKPETARLLSSLEGVDRVVQTDTDPGDFDYHCPIMSLPGIFDANLDNLPPPPMLSVPQASVEKMRPLFAAHHARFKVGIVWSGSLTFKNNRLRSTSLNRFLRFAEVPGVQLFSLQKGPLESQLAGTGADAVVVDIGGKVDDFCDTAAAIQMLDLVIMTDSSVSHLTASLGKPIWNLLDYVPYWLYLRDREDSPWYPTMRLFRQTRAGDWDGVFERAVAALGDAVAAKREGRWPS